MPRAALVTGAGQRIGREIALGLARAGWDVAVHFSRSRQAAEDTVDQITALGRRAGAVHCNFAADFDPQTLLTECEAQVGPMTCLVNNASLFAYDDAQSFDTPALLEHLRVNTAAPIRLAQALAQRLVAQAQGVVINILDQKLFNPNPDYLSYTLSKSALLEATRLLAMALAPRVRVLGLAPGITLPSGAQSQVGFERAHNTALLGASSTPADIASAVVYLAGAQAITGTTLLVDGGQHLQPSARDVMFLTEPS